MADAVWKILAKSEEIVNDSLFGAYSVVVANDADTPESLAIGVSEVLGRITGDIVGLDSTELATLIGVVEGANMTMKVVANGTALDALSATAQEGWFALNQTGDVLQVCITPQT